MKAELFSTDFLISIVLFMSVFMILVFYYNEMQDDIYKNYQLNDMQRKAISISDLLATSSGNPKFWDETNVDVIGLLDSGRFNLTKFLELKKLSHQDVKTMLGAGVYNLNISLTNETGHVIQIGSDFYTFGTPLFDVKNAALIKRFGIADVETQNKKVILEVVLWD
ncbi:MAG: hypothetical protein JW700_03520 [Candidatus Aenigmarchaeota archaeon]|nr:hypothetical protein [Candidatus Aenigmarchaeota archaeon]